MSSTVDTSVLTEQQLKDYNAQRSSYFKGTIAVSIIYGVFALSLFLIAFFSPAGKSVIIDKLLPFTVTFIGGMIIVVILLVISIFTVKPPPPFTLEYDNMKCPDYWQLQKTPVGILRGMSSENQSRMYYRCVKPQRSIMGDSSTDGVYSSSSVATTFKKNSADEKLWEVMQAAKGTTGTLTKATGSTDASATTNLRISCDVVYPDLMNFYDVTWKENNSVSPNRLRCKYANKCNIPWTSACPTN